MSIHFWSGTYGYSYPDYSKNLTNAQAQPETEKQQETTAAVQQAKEQPIELSPLRVNTRVTLGDPLADHQSFQTLDMRKAISDMQQDSVLAKYQHFIGNQEPEQPKEFNLDVTPVEQMQTQQPSSSLIVQDNDGVVILKK